MIAIFIDERGRSVQPKGPQRRDRHRHLISKAACHLNSARWLRLERPSSCRVGIPVGREIRSEEHTSELQSLMRISYAVFCLKKKLKKIHTSQHELYHPTHMTYNTKTLRTHTSL